MSHKLIIHKVSVQTPLMPDMKESLARCFFEYDGQKVLKVAPGNTPEQAVSYVADKVALWCGLSKRMVHAILRPIAFPETKGLAIKDIGDVDDIPF